jgi:hypothetical protein
MWPVWNQAVHTGKEIMKNKSYTINRKNRKKMPTRRYVMQEESQNKLNTRDLYEDKRNVRYEM